MLCHRGNDTAEALKFMKVAQDVMRKLGYTRRFRLFTFLTHFCYAECSKSLAEKLNNELNHQYQELLQLSTSPTHDR